MNQHSADQGVHSNPSVPSRVPQSTRGGWDEVSAEPKGNWVSSVYGVGISGAGLLASDQGSFGTGFIQQLWGFTTVPGLDRGGFISDGDGDDDHDNVHLHLVFSGVSLP